jgi:Alpha/beta hydrolase domain
MIFRLLISLIVLCSASSAAVVRIDVRERTPVLDGKPFGAAGAYERIKGRIHFEVDPKLTPNRIISDIDLGPQNARGRVAFSSDFYLLAPVDASRSNGTLLFEVSNRGRKGMLGMFNLATGSLDPKSEAEFGDGFLFQQGFTLAWLGWQFDVPEDPNLMRLYAPVAKQGNAPIRGLMRAEYVPEQSTLSFSLGDRTMIAYPVANPNDPELRLTVRDRRDGPRQTIPRDRWQFGRDKQGRPVRDRGKVFMASGFEPGKIYELVYPAQNPVLVGLGPAGIRDFISFLKHGALDGRDSAAPFRDVQRRFSRAVGFGVSQSGRFLRTFLYYGFNQDEGKRPVFDGVLVHVAGAGRGSFNYRFAQASRDGHPFMNCFYPTDIFPFTDLEQSDPETQLSDGILTRAMQVNVTPKVFYTNSSYEYYGRAASLIHTTVDGTQDASLAKDTRIYLLAGGQHGPAPFPPSWQRTQQMANPNDFRWSMRALLLALNRWVADGKEPPPSRYPRLADRNLTLLSGLEFPKLPGVRLPERIQTAYRLDFGPGFRSQGIVSLEPPKVGNPFPTLVPQVDSDGNEIAGIRLPEIQVPLATHTGWNLRSPELGAADELYSMVGSFIPFARTKAERLKQGDPRPSIKERYSNRQEYLEKVKAAAHRLEREGYLFESDIPSIVARAGSKWDYLLEPRP